MATFGQKVLAQREKLGLSQPALGKLAGLSYQAIQQIEDGTTKTTRRLLQLAEALQVPPQWLTTEDDRPPPAVIPVAPAPTTDINLQQMPRDLKILGGGVCGEGGLFELNGQILDYARRPPRLLGVRDAYALYIYSDCMSPWREHGDLVYVHPHQPVRVNDYVVVQLLQDGPGTPIPAYIKRLVRRTAESARLLQYNPRTEITIPTKKIGAIHRILDWSELMNI